MLQVNKHAFNVFLKHKVWLNNKLKSSSSFFEYCQHEQDSVKVESVLLNPMVEPNGCRIKTEDYHIETSRYEASGILNSGILNAS